MRTQHWQDIVSLVIGLWLMVSPLVLGFRGVPAGVTVILGIFVVLLAIEALILPTFLEELGEGVVGVSLVAAPWLVGFADTVAGVSGMIAGVAVTACAASELASDGEFIAWWRARGGAPGAG